MAGDKTLRAFVLPSPRTSYPRSARCAPTLYIRRRPTWELAGADWFLAAAAHDCVCTSPASQTLKAGFLLVCAQLRRIEHIGNCMTGAPQMPRRADRRQQHNATLSDAAIRRLEENGIR